MIYKTLDTYYKNILLFLLLVLFHHAHAATAPKSFADIVEPLLPSVVNISTTQNIEIKNTMKPYDVPEGSPLEDLFDRFEREMQPNKRNNRPDKRKATSLGSGFILDKQGYIVTNNHVIEKADEIKVILSDNREFEAKVIGTDNRTDLAVLKIHTDDDLPFVTFGNSNKLRIGDWVIAIGNPLGLGGTVTAGIVSARGRDILSGPYDNYIQTDASINRGNSGGPLFNDKGEVIGINTAIFSQTGGSIGIGFAIPSSQALQVIQQLKDFGETKRGWLGVTIQEVNNEIAQSLGLDKAKGALVSDLHPNGPSEKAGIIVGDIILYFDGQAVESSRQLPRMVARTDIGKKVKVVVFRNGTEKTIYVELGRLESALQEIDQLSKNQQPQNKENDDFNEFGLVLSTLNNNIRNDYNIDSSVEGLVITNIDQESEAYNRNLRIGDVISVVNQKNITSLSSFDNVVKEAKDRDRPTILLLVFQSGERRFISLPLKK